MDEGARARAALRRELGCMLHIGVQLVEVQIVVRPAVHALYGRRGGLLRLRLLALRHYSVGGGVRRQRQGHAVPSFFLDILL